MITESDILDTTKNNALEITTKKVFLYSLIFFYILTLPNFFKFLIRISWCHELVLDDVTITLKYLHASPSVECMSNLHILYILILIIPGFVIYLIGIFALIVYALKKKKDAIWRIGL